MPSLESWEMFAGVCSVIVLLGAVALALQRLGVIGKKPAPAPAPVPVLDAPREPSPEALALIEATRALVDGVKVTTERTEATGRVHMRLDDVNREIAASTAEVAELKGQLIQMNNTLHLIHEHLLNK